jgi:hypothetical protein
MNIKYLKGEKWLAIRGYEGLYEISNYGRVRSLNYRKTGKRKVLKCHARLGYYMKTSLVKDGVRKYYRVHRLVAEAFLPPPLEGHTQVHHKNGDKRDNRVLDGYSNLEWVTPQGNMADELTRYHLSISHQNPSPATRQRMSEAQKQRFARERETGTGRYSTQVRVSA